MCHMLKFVNEFHRVVNILYIHPVRSSRTLIFKADANSIFLSNNEAGLTPKEVFRRSYEKFSGIEEIQDTRKFENKPRVRFLLSRPNKFLMQLCFLSYIINKLNKLLFSVLLCDLGYEYVFIH